MRRVLSKSRIVQRVTSGRSEDGDTLVEVLLALVVLALAALALIIAFSTAVSASAFHRQLATAQVALGSASQQAIAEVEANLTLFSNCQTISGTSTSYDTLAPLVVTEPDYTAAITNVEWWDTNSGQFQPSSYFESTYGVACAENEPQSITVTVTYTNGTTVKSYSNSVVGDYPLANAADSSNAGAAYKLVFAPSTPGNGVDNLAFATQPVVYVEDQFGNVVSTDLSPVTLSISSGTSGAVLSGCSGSEVNGQVTFTGCEINLSGTYTLLATDGTLLTATSSSFTVGGTAPSLVFTRQPVMNNPSGSSFSTEPVIAVQDPIGITDTAWSGTVTLSTSGGVFSSNCDSITIVNGLEQTPIPTCTFQGAYTYNPSNGQSLPSPYTMTASATGLVPVTSSSFEVNATGPASQLYFSTQPTGVASSSATTSFATQPSITVEDAFGNQVTSFSGTVAMSISTGGSTGCSQSSSEGVVTFSGCHGSAFGTGITMTATSGSFSVTSTPFDITTPATKLVFTQQPVAGASGSTLITEPVITIYDASNRVVTASTTPIGLTASGGTLAFCSNETPSYGVVTVATCTFAGIVGTNYTMTATQGAETPVVSAPFSPTGPGSPSQLVFTTQPVAGPSQSVLTTQPVLRIEDSAGNVVTSSSTTTVTLTSSGGTLASCANENSVSGVVAVSNCTFAGVVGSPYTIYANANGFPQGSSNPISPTAAGPASQIALSGCQPSVQWNANCLLSATVQDEYANTVLTTNTPVIFQPVSGTGALSGLTTVNPVNGVATDQVTGLTVGSLSVQATSGSIVSGPLNVNVLGATQTVAFYTSNAYTTTTTGATTTFAPSGTYATFAKGSASGVITFASSTPSVCSVNSSSGLVAFVTGGTCSITAQAGATTTYAASATTTFTLTISPATQTITFTSAAPTTANVGGATYTPTTSATSGLVVTITVDSSSSSICSINSGVVSFHAVGTCTLDANQAGNASWSAATQVQQSFTVAKGAQTITFTSTAPAAAKVAGATYTPTATATSGLAVTITVDSSSSSICSINSGVVSFQGVGTCTLDANQAGNTTWLAATQVQQSFAVGKGAQTITFTSTAPSAAGVGGATYTPTATATSGLAVTITVDSSSSSICSINSGVVSFQGVGTCTLDANQAGNTTWLAATQVQQSFAVAKGTQTVAFYTSNAYTTTTTGATTTFAPSGTYATFAKGSASGVITFASSTPSVCSVNSSSGLVAFVTGGTCSITAQAGATTTYAASATTTFTLTISPATQTITFTSAAPVAAKVGGAAYTPTTSATSGLVVTITVDSSSSSICSINSGVVSFLAVGTCTLDANQAGNASWSAATQVQQSFAVGKGAQTITFTSTAPSAAGVGGATYTPTATATSGLAVTITVDSSSSSICSINSGVVSFQGVGNCVLDANQAGNATWLAATQVQQSFAVGKGAQTITFTSTAPSAAGVGGATYTPTATATSGLAVTITVDSSSSSICSINSGVVSFQGVGNCVLDANQAGNATWLAATQVQQSFAVAKGTQTVAFYTSNAYTTTTTGATTTFAPSGTYATFAKGSASGVITFASSTPSVCSVNSSSGLVAFVTGGTCSITAQAGATTTYAASATTTFTLTISPATQTITFTSAAPVAAKVGGAAYTPTTSATSGLVVTITVDSSSSSICSINSGVVSFLAVGTCTLDANQAGNASWSAATQVQQSFAVGKGAQTITFTSTAPTRAAINGYGYTPTATATSGLAVTITVDSSSSSICSINSGVVSFQGVGNCVLDANQAGNASWSAATQVQQTIKVVSPVLTFLASGSQGSGNPISTSSNVTAPSGTQLIIVISDTPQVLLLHVSRPMLEMRYPRRHPSEPATGTWTAGNNAVICAYSATATGNSSTVSESFSSSAGSSIIQVFELTGDSPSTFTLTGVENDATSGVSPVFNGAPTPGSLELLYLAVDNTGVTVNTPTGFVNVSKITGTSLIASVTWGMTANWPFTATNMLSSSQPWATISIDAAP